MIPAPRQSTQADIEALQAVCEHLAGFGSDTSVEWVDGFLTALAAGPRAVPQSEWLPALFDANFERAYPDPVAAAPALAALDKRLKVLASHLHAEALSESPDEIRLAPLMLTFDDAARAELVAAGHLSADEAQEALQTGAEWAEGFNDAMVAFADDWPEAMDDEEDNRWYDNCQSRILALLWTGTDLSDYLAAEYPGQTLSRDELIDEAMFAVQDLRLFWIEHAPKPATRHVIAQPGRNDPCHCGSGKKFKKCHGAAA